MSTLSSPSASSTGRERFSWALYDFANSAYPTVIITALYVLYFRNIVVETGEPGRADKLWGMANSIGAAIIFVLAPILGAVADVGSKKRLFLIVFSTLCIVATALLSTTGSGTVSWAVALVVLSVVGFEGSLVFYNSFLPDLAPNDKIGRLSGQGWALGYVGGLGCMLAVLPVAERFLAQIPLIVAGWYLVFSLPAFFMLRDRVLGTRLTRGVVFAGVRQYGVTLKTLPSYTRLFRFLIAYFFYNNAVLTIIVFAVAFSSETLSFSIKENILLIAAMNVVAAPGALLFGWISDRIGAKTTIIITLVMWLLVVIGAEIAAWPGLFDIPRAKMVFWAVSVLASLCIGATQATSRGFVGQLAPENRSAEFYGFMAFAGKGSAIVGPLVFGLVSDAFDSQRAAVATIGVFFLLGLALLMRVPNPRKSSPTV